MPDKIIQRQYRQVAKEFSKEVKRQGNSLTLLKPARTRDGQDIPETEEPITGLVFPNGDISPEFLLLAGVNIDTKDPHIGVFDNKIIIDEGDFIETAEGYYKVTKSQSIIVADILIAQFPSLTREAPLNRDEY